MTPRQLSDHELRAVAVSYCTLEFVEAYADLIDPEVTFSFDAENIDIAEIPYSTKVSLLMRAASYSPFPH